MTEPAEIAAVTQPKSNNGLPVGYFARVPLRTPVKRGEMTISELLLRDANGIALMDVNMYDLMRMQTKEIITILPRISEPSLTTDEAMTLAGYDLYTIGQEISAFLLL